MREEYIILIRRRMRSGGFSNWSVIQTAAEPLTKSEAQTEVARLTNEVLGDHDQVGLATVEIHDPNPIIILTPK